MPVDTRRGGPDGSPLRRVRGHDALDGHARQGVDREALGRDSNALIPEVLRAAPETVHPLSVVKRFILMRHRGAVRHEDVA